MNLQLTELEKKVVDALAKDWSKTPGYYMPVSELRKATKLSGKTLSGILGSLTKKSWVVDEVCERERTDDIDIGLTDEAMRHLGLPE